MRVGQIESREHSRGRSTSPIQTKVGVEGRRKSVGSNKKDKNTIDVDALMRDVEKTIDLKCG